VTTQPNVLWICTDQQRFDTIHALGNESIRTPNLDRLVQEGVTFSNAYTQSPICTPSRAAFLTGCYPSTLHVNRNGNAYFPSDAADKLITRRLANAGYTCGLAGKLHLSAANKRVEKRPPDDGYHFFKWSHHPTPEDFWPLRHHAYQAWVAEQGVEWEDIYGGEYSGVPAEYHQTTWCANEAIDFMTQERQGPWLMSVNPFDPHPPFDPPPAYMARMDVESLPLPLFQPSEMESQLAFSDIDHQTETPQDPEAYDARRMIAAYYAQIELIDDQVGRMLDALEETGQRENTIVIFMSDHGEMLGDHGLILKGCRFYEGAVHIPLIISWPGQFQSNVRSEALVELVDIVPTLLESLGMSIPGYVQGKSLWPLLTGQPGQGIHRDFARSEYHDALHRHFVRCEYHDALARPHASHANMIFDGRYKLVAYHGHDVGELYDLKQDPNEFRNLWWEPSHQDMRFALLKRCFDAVMEATDDGQPRVALY
jgi:arylsulfatase A-like enzyme